MTIRVMAHTKSKKPRILEREPGVFDIYVAEAAVDGKANEAITKFLAKHLGLSPSMLKIVSGRKSKAKLFRILVP